ncbi:MAG: phosphoenolpyruvate--protein phosphotransferase [Candidatus Omnitrophica bacterium]|nr:phosphoenolpyruvate--protein phosphotransferase [Candidatus Omnitrophota bacterium]
MFKGIAASPGVAIGKVFLYNRDDSAVPRRKIKSTDVPKEIARFEEALIKTGSEIATIRNNISREMGIKHGEIFNAHLLVLEDRMIIDEVISRLRSERLNIEAAFEDVLKKYIRVFQKMDDKYLRERISDIEDVGKRLLRNLLGKKRQTLLNLPANSVVVAYDLSPSDTATMHRKNVIAFITDIGGKTSHTAIMAKSLEIPAVVGLENATGTVKNNDTIIVDGTKGLVFINPKRNILDQYLKEQKRLVKYDKELSESKSLPAETKDTHHVELAANIEIPEEIPAVIEHGAQGIGLYRTEYFYMNRPDLPTEEEHYSAYSEVASKIRPHAVTIRTLDLGGDKFLSQLKVPKEMNPFLGWRAIRLSLAKPELFKTQLRAILRASVHGKVRLMYPMISGVEELVAANKFLEEAKKELKAKRMPFDKNIEVGVMIEVPSAALIADILATKVDFFSIGTNDLIQYALAVDRVNEKIAYLYEPLHPAVLRLIKRIIDAGHSKGIWVGMCGEMAGEPAFAPLLLGLGLDEFSVPLTSILKIKKIIRSVNYDETKRLAEEALDLPSAREVEALLRKKFNDVISDTMQDQQ